MNQCWNESRSRMTWMSPIFQQAPECMNNITTVHFVRYLSRDTIAVFIGKV